MMAFVHPVFDPEIVDLAGDALIDYADALEFLEQRGLDYLEIINNWRLSHAYPLNTFQMTLRHRAFGIDSQRIVAQRIKRRDSIEDKLRRYDWLKLSEIQDIGGCRAIVTTTPQVYGLVELYKRKYSSHQLIDHDDYIKRPKQDGYRGYHLIYRYSDPKHSAYEV